MEGPPPSSPLLAAGSLLRDRWEVVKKIGGGGFGEVYKAQDHATGQACALKVESCVSSKQVLKMEVAVLKRLQGSTLHACQFLGCGRNNKVNYIVMSLLGPSLSELRKRQPHQHFSLSTTLRVGLQVLDSIRAVHDCGFLHRDIKPSNFAIGSTPETCRICYVLDFGLSRQYTMLTGEVRQARPTAGFRGTVRYASINAHLSRDLGRHDDLWSVFYMLVELATGQLPWRKIKDKDEAGKSKANCDHKKLVQALPCEFEIFLSHLKALSYSEKPDYGLIEGALRKAMRKVGVHESDAFDWEQDYSAPSITTASGVSPPAIINRDNLAVVPSAEREKLDAARVASRTNVSAVAELSEQAPAGKADMIFPTTNAPNLEKEIRWETEQGLIEENNGLSRDERAPAVLPNGLPQLRSNSGDGNSVRDVSRPPILNGVEGSSQRSTSTADHRDKPALEEEKGGRSEEIIVVNRYLSEEESSGPTSLGSKVGDERESPLSNISLGDVAVEEDEEEFVSQLTSEESDSESSYSNLPVLHSNDMPHVIMMDASGMERETVHPDTSINPRQAYNVSSDQQPHPVTVSGEGISIQPLVISDSENTHSSSLSETDIKSSGSLIIRHSTRPAAEDTMRPSNKELQQTQKHEPVKGTSLDKPTPNQPAPTPSHPHPHTTLLGPPLTPSHKRRLLPSLPLTLAATKTGPQRKARLKLNYAMVDEKLQVRTAKLGPVRPRPPEAPPPSNHTCVSARRKRFVTARV